LDLKKHNQKASNLKKENRIFFDKLKRTKPKNLDDQFHELHEEVFETIDCLACANCCKTTSPIFYNRDIERLSKHLKQKPGDFIDKYLRIDEDKDYVLRQASCPFLGADNYCSVYEARPTACREYPHTNRKRMEQILDLTFQNTIVCPAVLEIIERLKKIV
jgi:Fe-S-cluster containining protein